MDGWSLGAGTRALAQTPANHLAACKILSRDLQNQSSLDTNSNTTVGTQPDEASSRLSDYT